MTTRVKALLVSLAMAASLAASAPARAGTLVTISTSFGDVKVDLFDQLAPKTTANFLNYVNNQRYTNTIFHQAAKGATVQGGAYVRTSLERIPAFDLSANDQEIRSNTRGTLAMTPFINSPNSSTSRWFFNLQNNTNFDTANSGFGLTVFGWVVGGGMSILDQIGNLPTLQNLSTGNSTNDTLTSVPLNGSSFVIINSILASPAHPDFQNPVQSLDVNNDNALTTLDALQVINDLISHGSHPVSTPFSGTSYLDVNGDSNVSPLDALQVINHFLTPAAPQATLAAARSGALVVPEPSSCILAGLGSAALAAYALRRRFRPRAL